MSYLRSIIRKIFNIKPKFRVYNNEVATEAFRFNGKTYFHFEDSFKIPAGRAICALAIYDELSMRCTRDYLRMHIEAIELLLNPSDKKINLTTIAQIHNNLKERLNLAPFPDHIYKLASVTYFDEGESPFSYDFEYNKKKISEWKKDPAMLDFFLTTRFKDLMPFGDMSRETAARYFQVTELIDKNHLQSLQAIISKRS